MKHEKKLKEYEAVWTCDFCGKEFKTKKESDQHELSCSKNKKQNNNLLVFIIFGLLLLSIGYLYGKNQELEKNSKKNDYVPTPTSQSITPTTKPTIKKVPNSNQVKPTNTPIPERKKVTVSISEVTLSGTYYCYEDKANILTQKQTDLNNLHKIFDICGSNLSYKISQCNYNDPSSNCPNGTECNDKLNDIEKAREELRNLIKSNCP